MARERLPAALNLQHLTAMSTSCHRLPAFRVIFFFHMTVYAGNTKLRVLHSTNDLLGIILGRAGVFRDCWIWRLWHFVRLCPTQPS